MKLFDFFLWALLASSLGITLFIVGCTIVKKEHDDAEDQKAKRK